MRIGRTRMLKFIRKVEIIGYGLVDGKPAIEFEVGDKILFNYGYIRPVVDKKVKGNWVYLTVENEEGERYTIRKRKDTLLAISPS